MYPGFGNPDTKNYQIGPSGPIFLTINICMQLSNSDFRQFDKSLFGLNDWTYLLFMDPKKIPHLYLRVNQEADTGNVLNDSLILANSLNNVIKDTDKWLEFLDTGPLGQVIKEYAQSLWVDARSKISSCKSINIFLEGYMPHIGATPTGLFRHRHMLHRNGTKHNVLTYVTPIMHMNGTTEYMSYADFESAGYPAKSFNDIQTPNMTPVEQAAAWAAYSTSCQHQPGVEWKKELFPGFEETLRLQFNASRYSHGIDGMIGSSNVFCIVTFNDVIYHNGLDEKEYVAELFDNKYFSNADSPSTSDSSDA